MSSKFLTPIMPVRRQSSSSSVHMYGRKHQSQNDSADQQAQHQQQQQQQDLLDPYYHTLSPSLRAKFGGLDVDATYIAAEDAVLDPETHNFVVDFGKNAAYVAKNIGLTSGDDIEGFLGSSIAVGGRPRNLRTRWICILGPHRQPDLVQTIGKKYGLSPRHINLLLSQPPDLQAQATSPLTSRIRRVAERIAHHRKSMEKFNDIENGAEMNGSDGTEKIASSIKESTPASAQSSSYMSLVSKVWHWHAVEWGGRFLCIGYNAVHNVPSWHDHGTSPAPVDGDHFSSKNNSSLWSGSSNVRDTPEREHKDDDPDLDTGKNSPEGLRLWTWIILCDDGTIISLHELHPRRTYVSPLDYKAEIAIVRRNILTVFRSLSRAPISLAISNSEKLKGGLGALDVLPFRRQELEEISPDSEPSLLFYYLFDDWYSSWSLAIERQHPYTKRMRKLRSDLIRDPELKHVDSLLHLARQLAILKRMYETYVLIIDRILYRQENSLGMTRSGGKVIVIGTDHPEAGVDANPTSPKEVTILGDPKILGVPLSPLAVARFERLRDRIKLYALAEIQDCLDEKDGLVSMTFQLIAFKQTSAVERLTRVAILFAGATILFLPLTLITGFFSMEIDGMKGRWKEADFWGSSGVALLLTVALLIGVIKYSDAVESVKITTQRARAAGQSRGWWGKNKRA